jgi:hypothetical protein
MKIDVSRGSQFQYEPQVFLAKIDPDTAARMQKIIPNLAADDSLRSYLRFLVERYLTEKYMAVPNATTVAIAIGRWKYIILKISGLSLTGVGGGKIQAPIQTQATTTRIKIFHHIFNFS